MKKKLSELGLPVVVELTFVQKRQVIANEPALREKFDFYFLGDKLVVTHQANDVRLECANDFLIHL